MNLDDKGIDISDYKPKNNYVLVKPDLDQDKGKHGLSYDTTFEEAKHAPRTGVIAAVPDELYFHPNRQGSILWDTDMELEVGDRVTYHFLSGMTAERKNNERLIVAGGEKYYLMQYERLFTAERLNKKAQAELKTMSLINATMSIKHYEKLRNKVDLICLNGFVLIEPVKNLSLEKYKNLLEIPNKDDRHFGIVRHFGSLNRSYRDSHKNYHGPDQDNLKVGEVVVMDQICDTPLEMRIHMKMKQMFFRVQRRYILGGFKLN